MKALNYLKCIINSILLIIYSLINGKDHCYICHKHATLLPKNKSGSFLIKSDKEFITQFNIEKNDDIILYGYTIETRHDYGYKKSNWYQYSTNKVYKSGQSALEALNTLMEGYYRNEEFRIVPLYRLSLEFSRTMKINKIL